MQIKFTAPDGWRESFSDKVMEHCVKHNVPFVDRGMVLNVTARHGEMIKAAKALRVAILGLGGQNIQAELERMGIRDYAYFAHRTMQDLHFNLEVPLETDDEVQERRAREARPRVS